MANQAADNAKTAGDLLVWQNPGGYTPVVWSYTCPVDSHKVVSAVHLGYDSGGTLVDTTPVCPLHDATLTAWKFHDVS
jgi:hypothetical protein